MESPEQKIQYRLNAVFSAGSNKDPSGPRSELEPCKASIKHEASAADDANSVDQG